MAVFDLIIEAFMGPVIQTRHDLASGGPVGSRLVRSDPFGHETPAFHQLDQKSLGRALVSLGLKDFLKNHAVLVDRAPGSI
tara:strand:- start:1089 stop:1331 length:243 start_codon:yes stop_codon:yes gene_type:complete